MVYFASEQKYSKSWQRNVSSTLEPKGRAVLKLLGQNQAELALFFAAHVIVNISTFGLLISMQLGKYERQITFRVSLSGVQLWAIMKKFPLK